MSLQVTFKGATETVTGSSFLIETDNYKFLVDHGMYQGPEVSERNLDSYDFDPSEIDFLLLTHAHLDHCGLIPKLVRHGFNGPIYCTAHTAQIAEIIFLDSAKIQESNFTEGIPWDFTDKVAYAYDSNDADNALEQIRVVDYDEPLEPVDGVEIIFKRVGHILGAASIEIEHENKRVAFSGDIGRLKHELIPPFDQDYAKEVDYVVMESLYGGEEHPERSESVQKLINAINNTLDRNGTVFIPSFAVQRTQEILHDLKIAKESGALDDHVPVWLDSPMAQRVTSIYRDALDHSEESLFDFDGLKFVRNYRQSQKISQKQRQIIIAGSGMVSGGRIMDHLAANIEKKKNSVIFVGYQADGTAGREIVDGNFSVLLNEQSRDVKAQIHYLRGFSAHGDTSDYIDWLGRYNSSRLKNTYLVHADLDRAEALKERLEKDGIDHPYIPSWNETIKLW